MCLENQNAGARDPGDNVGQLVGIESKFRVINLNCDLVSVDVQNLCLFAFDVGLCVAFFHADGKPGLYPCCFLLVVGLLLVACELVEGTSQRILAIVLLQSKQFGMAVVGRRSSCKNVFLCRH